MHRIMRAVSPALSPRLVRIARVALVVACLSAAGRPATAADTDVVVLRNGDRLHGEIKGLRFGRLELSTTSMSTIYVEWDKVVGLTSPSFFEIETADGIPVLRQLRRRRRRDAARRPGGTADAAWPFPSS